MCAFFWLLFLCQFYDSHAQYEPNQMSEGDNRTHMSRKLIHLSEEIMERSMQHINSLYKARYDNQLSAPYEVGYLTQTIHEFFRRMLEKWHTAHLMNTQHYSIELTLYLEDIEHKYWAIRHVSNMMHEIERKYKVKGGLEDTYEDPSHHTETPFPTVADIFKANKAKNSKFGSKSGSGSKYSNKKKKKFVPYGMGTTTKRKRGPGRFPIDYGDDVYDWNSNT